MAIAAWWVPRDSWIGKQIMLSALSGRGERLPSLGKKCLGVVGKRGEFQTHTRCLGVQRFAGEHLGIDIRKWCMPWWFEREPDVGIGCDLPRNGGLGIVRPGQTQQGAWDSCLRDHFAIYKKQ